MTLTDLNSLEKKELREALTKCCGAGKWVDQMFDSRPFTSRDDIFNKSDTAWEKCSTADYLEAFSHHPKIGDVASLEKKFGSTAKWAEGEQAAVKNSAREVLEALAECNRLYEEKFGYIFIINATGKSAEEILGTLRWRLLNTPEDEIHIAAEEQHAITKIRLEKLLS